MMEEDLRFKQEDRRRGGPYFNQQEQGQSLGPPIKCFNCNEDGHHWSTCKKPAFCYNCRETGHKSANCPLRANKGLCLCAIGMPGQLFYSLNLPKPKNEVK